MSWREHPQRLNWFRDAVKQLRELERLEAGWDSHGAAPIPAQTIHHAIGVLRSLQIPGVYEPSIVPTSAGSVQFEWHPGNVDLEIEVAATGDLNVFLSDHITGNKEETVLSSNADLSPFLQTLVSRLV